MGKQFTKELPHNPVEPVVIMRGDGDSVIIEGVEFSGNFFRSFKSELSHKVLYHIDEHGKYHIIRTLHEACGFFAPELLKEIDHA